MTFKIDALSAGAEQYANCISAKGKSLSQRDHLLAVASDL